MSEAKYHVTGHFRINNLAYLSSLCWVQSIVRPPCVPGYDCPIFVYDTCFGGWIGKDGSDV
jgi:hypothetical protein